VCILEKQRVKLGALRSQGSRRCKVLYGFKLDISLARVRCLTFSRFFCQYVVCVKSTVTLQAEVNNPPGAVYIAAVTVIVAEL